MYFESVYIDLLHLSTINIVEGHCLSLKYSMMAAYLSLPTLMSSNYVGMYNVLYYERHSLLLKAEYPLHLCISFTFCEHNFLIQPLHYPIKNSTNTACIAMFHLCISITFCLGL